MTATGDAPATRKDLLEFMEHITRSLDAMRSDIVQEMDAKMDEKISGSEHRMLLSMEQLRHDMIETHKDKIDQHEDRITNLEVHLKLKAA